MNKKYLVAFLILLVIILGIAVYFITAVKPHQNNAISNTAENTKQDWQIYNNEKYGYSIEYPAGWHFQSISADSDFLQQGPNKYNIFAGQWYVTPEDPGKYNMSNLPENLYEVSFMIYQADPDITLTKFFSNLKLDLTKTKQEVIEINGVPAYKLNLLSVDSNTGKTGEYNDIYIKQGDKVFVISYHDYPISDGNRAIAERMINSFRVKK